MTATGGSDHTAPSAASGKLIAADGQLSPVSDAGKPIEPPERQAERAARMVVRDRQTAIPGILVTPPEIDSVTHDAVVDQMDRVFVVLDLVDAASDYDVAAPEADVILSLRGRGPGGDKER